MQVTTFTMVFFYAVAAGVILIAFRLCASPVSYFCSEANKIEFYKKYRNKLTHVKSLAKSQYYNKLLTENRSNPKKTWEVLGQIIEGRSKSRNKLPTSLKINGQICETDSDEFLNRMCDILLMLVQTYRKEISLTFPN